jgi:hypothetical protein
MNIPDPNLDFLPISYPGSRVKKGTGIPDTQHCLRTAQHTYINVPFFQDIKMDTDSKEEMEGPEPVSPSPVKANGTSK